MTMKKMLFSSFLILFCSTVLVIDEHESIALENEFVKVLRQTCVGFNKKDTVFAKRIIVALTSTKIVC